MHSQVAEPCPSAQDESGRGPGLSTRALACEVTAAARGSGAVVVSAAEAAVVSASAVGLRVRLQLVRGRQLGVVRVLAGDPLHGPRRAFDPLTVLDGCRHHVRNRARPPGQATDDCVDLQCLEGVRHSVFVQGIAAGDQDGIGDVEERRCWDRAAGSTASWSIGCSRRPVAGRTARSARTCTATPAPSTRHSARL